MNNLIVFRINKYMLQRLKLIFRVIILTFLLSLNLMYAFCQKNGFDNANRNIHSELASCRFQVFSYDENGNIVKDSSIKLTFTQTVTNENCSSANDGSVTINATSNIPVNLVYSIDGISNANNIFTNLDSGIHVVTVSLAGHPELSCSIKDTVNTNLVAAVSTSATFSTICKGTSTTISATGANSYTWMPGTLTGSSIIVNPNATTTYTVTGNNSNGCTSSMTKTITVNPYFKDSNTVIYCDNYIWQGTTYTSSGIYVHTLLNNFGCKDTNMLFLTINHSDTSTSNVTSCNYYTWPYNNQTYVVSGTYTSTSTNAQGCIHYQVLNLMIIKPIATTAYACNSYFWPISGQTYTSSGTYYGLNMNNFISYGCFTIDTLFLSINTTTTNGSLSTTACTSYSWNGTTYSSSGNYTFTSLNQCGLLNTATLNLTIYNNTSTGSVNTTVCDSYVWVSTGLTYTTSGIYTKTSINAQGCLNTATLNLIVNQSSSTSLHISACNSYTWLTGNGLTYTNTGIYTRTTSNFGGCPTIDSLILNLTTGEWSWVGGKDSVEVGSTYGTLGVPALTNQPGSRFGSATWTDKGGNFWMYGGTGSSAIQYGHLNEMWKFNPSTGLWTWMGGNSPNSYGVYMNFGGFSLNSKPGARSYMISWTDTSGFFWMFGGYGYSASNFGYLNDLWKYDPTTGIWAWMGGPVDTVNKNGIYGTQGIPSLGNYPGGRQLCVGWVDTINNLWLFGGEGHASSSVGSLNDLWKYNIYTNQWTWVKGSDTSGKASNYGITGISNMINTPGARYSSATWIDQAGNLWLMGGKSSISQWNYLNDLWKFNTNSNHWTWEGGQMQTSAPVSDYSTVGTFSTSNQPGGRSYSHSWKDINGKFWLMGGNGYDATNSIGLLNDLWCYDITIGQWAYIGGDMISNSFGVYGPPTNSYNNPGGRYFGQKWTDRSGNLWLMGV